MTQEYKCKCKGEKGSSACSKATYDNNSTCGDCLSGRHSHEFYRHLDIPGGCFYGLNREGDGKRRVCLICESNNSKVM